MDRGLQKILDKKLIEAARHGNTGLLKKLLAEGARVNSMDEKGWTALHNAASLGYTKCVRILIAAGADANVKRHKGDTPLRYAVEHGRTETVSALIDLGADINADDTDSGDILMYAACYTYNAEIIKCLIAAGSDVNAKNEAGWTALHYAAAAGGTACMRMLISSGADLYAEHRYGETPENILRTEHRELYEKYINELKELDFHMKRIRSEDIREPAHTGFEYDI